MSRIADALARAGAGNIGSADLGTGAWDFSSPRPSPEPIQRSSPQSLTPAAEEAPARLPVPDEVADRLVGSATMSPATLEQFRRLAAVLHRSQCEHAYRVLMVTSALPGEGKTLLAANLALVLSESFGRSVLLMDIDLRRPCLHTMFGIENRGGIAEYLSRPRPDSPAAAVRLSPTLSLMVAGKPQADPMRIVVGEGMRQLVEAARHRYDWVILDTPPIGLLSDAHLLGAMADRALLVVQAGKTPYDAIQKAVSTIGQDRIVGTVLNRAEGSIAAPYGHGYDSYYGKTASKG